MRITQSLSDRWFAWRNRFQSSPAVHARALRNPFIRFMANNRARRLFDLCAGFVYSQILAACVRLNVFEALLEGPLPVDTIADRIGLTPDATSRLMQAAAGLQLTERRPDGRYGLGILGLAIPRNPAITAMVEHHAALYADLRDPVALLRGTQADTELARIWSYVEPDRRSTLSAGDVAEYSALMAASQPLVAADILSVYRFDRHRCLMDIGGGDGTFLAAVGAAAPALRLILVDLPPVADRARARFTTAGLGGRAIAIGADIHTAPLPLGADVITLVRVVHDHNDEAAMTILRTARSALPQGGTLLLAEPMADTPGAGTVGSYFAFYLLAMRSGRPRSAAELTRMLRAAGFREVVPLPTRRPLLVRVLRAR